MIDLGLGASCQTIGHEMSVILSLVLLGRRIPVARIWKLALTYIYVGALVM